MPLALTGVEHVWAKVLTAPEFGLAESDVRAWFGDTAHLAWARMGNTHGTWNGPLPAKWLKQQWDLQRHVLKYMRSFGMTPVLPGFAGHIPEALAAKFPNANVKRLGNWLHEEPRTGTEAGAMAEAGTGTGTVVSGGSACPHSCALFLDPTDPLFRDVGTAFIRQLSLDFGTDHYYIADSFNENTPLSNTADHLQAVGRATLGAMRDADPKAVWVVQGWMFHNNRTFWREPQRRAFLSSVPIGDMLVLDLTAEREAYYRHAPANFGGQPFIWCMLHNFGGNIGMHGRMPAVAAGPAEALTFDPSRGRGIEEQDDDDDNDKSGAQGGGLYGADDDGASATASSVDGAVATRNANAINADVDPSLSIPSGPSVVGVGMTMEGIEQNPVLYELMALTAQSAAPISMDDFLDDYARRRYGGPEFAADADAAMAAAAAAAGSSTDEAAAMEAATTAGGDGLAGQFGLIMAKQMSTSSSDDNNNDNDDGSGGAADWAKTVGSDADTDIGTADVVDDGGGVVFVSGVEDPRATVAFAEAAAAWRVLGATVYNTTAREREGHVRDACSWQPSLWADTLNPDWYDARVLLEGAFRRLLNAAPTVRALGSGSRIDYDIVDVGRQLLARQSTVIATELRAALVAADGEAAAAAGEAMLRLLDDMDSLLATHEGFLLGPWLQSAKMWAGRDDDAAIAIERSARSLISSWGPSGSRGSYLRDYANRQWSGMLGSGGHPAGNGPSTGLYYRRWFAFIAQVRVAIAMGGFKTGWNQTAWEEQDSRIVKAWVESEPGKYAYPIQPRGDTVAVARSIYRRYSKRIVSSGTISGREKEEEAAAAAAADDTGDEGEESGKGDDGGTTSSASDVAANDDAAEEQLRRLEESLAFEEAALFDGR